MILWCQIFTFFSNSRKFYINNYLDFKNIYISLANFYNIFMKNNTTLNKTFFLFSILSQNNTFCMKNKLFSRS